METILIGTSLAADAIAERLRFEAGLAAEDGYRLEIRFQRRDRWEYLTCQFATPYPVTVETSRAIRHLVADALADVIVERMEPAWLERAVERNYGYFGEGARREIARLARARFYGNAEGRPGLSYRIARRSQLFERLSDFLERHAELVVDGFLRFRMKEYVQAMEDAVDEAVDEYLNRREQEELIGFLRELLASRKPRLPEVHVLVGPGGSFYLADGRHRQLSQERLLEMGVELGEGTETADLLLGALLSVAPARVLLHGAEHLDGSALAMARGIFAERLELCPGCAWCRRAVFGGRPSPR
ncbi:MAG: putative sporulation protein YtxC [Clostridia bacterium]|nr:putative sporulation protein YtxC [Clostridia bacterium]MCL6522317.1 putative sporulation protein YtxC [Bacillota bacterium]